MFCHILQKFTVRVSKDPAKQSMIIAKVQRIFFLKIGVSLLFCSFKIINNISKVKQPALKLYDQNKTKKMYFIYKPFSLFNTF